MNHNSNILQGNSAALSTTGRCAGHESLERRHCDPIRFGGVSFSAPSPLLSASWQRVGAALGDGAYSRQGRSMPQKHLPMGWLAVCGGRLRAYGSHWRASSPAIGSTRASLWWRDREPLPVLP